jgi:hypothetical protein
MSDVVSRMGYFDYIGDIGCGNGESKNITITSIGTYLFVSGHPSGNVFVLICAAYDGYISMLCGDTICTVTYSNGILTVTSKEYKSVRGALYKIGWTI